MILLYILHEYVYLYIYVIIQKKTPVAFFFKRSHALVYYSEVFSVRCYDIDYIFRTRVCWIKLYLIRRIKKAMT